jgi:hypothetical protein
MRLSGLISAQVFKIREAASAVFARALSEGHWSLLNAPLCVHAEITVNTGDTDARAVIDPD